MSNDTQNIIDALLQFAAEQDRASCTAFALLLHAEKHQGKQVQAVVEALENVKMSTAFTTFRYLVKRGYLETKPDPQHHRANLLYLSEQGQKLVEMTRG